MKIDKLLIMILVVFSFTACAAKPTAATTTTDQVEETPTDQVEETPTDEVEETSTDEVDKAPTDEGEVTVETLPETAATDSPDMGKSLLATDEEIIYITENRFIAQTNDVYINTEDYMGKTLQYEGFVMSFFDESTQKTYYYVIRYGPGCCGYDANAGFEILTQDGEYPADNEWVQVTGVLGTYVEGEYEYLYLDVTDLQVLKERGAETVTQ